MLYKKKEIEVNNNSYEVLIYVEKRNNSRASIGKKINIRLPEFIPKEEREEEIKKILDWARKKLRRTCPCKRQTEKEIKNNDIIKVQGFEYTVNVYESEKNSSSARIYKNKIQVNLSSRLNEAEKKKHIKCLVYRCIASHWQPFVENKAKEFNEKYFGKEINSVRLKNLKSKWGSCSCKKNINLNTALLFAPEEVLDYVLIHELAHLVEPNHSNKFWEQVERAMPDYREKVKWLKRNKRNLLS